MRTPDLGEHKPVLIDIAVLLAIPAALTLIHYVLPDALSNQLLFTYGDSSPITAWTAALLHGSNTHLYGNIVGYGLAIGFGYFLYVAHLQARRRFWLTAGVLVVLVPPITTAIDYVVLYQYAGVLADGATSRGISAVVSAFGGMLLAAIGFFVADEYGTQIGTLAVLLIWMASLGVLAATTGAMTPALAGLFVLGSLLFAAAFANITGLADLARLPARVAEHAENIVQVGCFGAVVALLFLLMVPDDVVHGDTFINVLSHATGFLLGLVFSLLVYQVSSS